MSGPWRDPPEETIDLYPSLVVHDGRVSGSITLGRSRLPIWCFLPDFPEWDAYLSGERKPGDPHYGVSKDALREFIHNLLEQRGEFARLLLVLADAERCDREPEGGPPWWERPEIRDRVLEQLQRCVAALESADA